MPPPPSPPPLGPALKKREVRVVGSPAAPSSTTAMASSCSSLDSGRYTVKFNDDELSARA